MTKVDEKIFDEAVSLPADSRIQLIEKLLMSLNLPTKPEIERLWAKEAERRVEQIERGEVELIPSDKVFEKLRRKYQK